MTEDDMVGWHHRLDGCEFEQALRVGDGQGSLASCSPWDCKELDMTEWLNWIGLILPSSCYLLAFNLGHSPKSVFLNLFFCLFVFHYWLFLCPFLLITFPSMKPEYCRSVPAYVCYVCLCLVHKVSENLSCSSVKFWESMPCINWAHRHLNPGLPFYSNTRHHPRNVQCSWRMTCPPANHIAGS